MLRLEIRLIVVLATVVLLGLLLLQIKFDRDSYTRDGLMQDAFGPPQAQHRGRIVQPGRQKGAGRMHNDWYTFDPLPQSVINAVDRFVFFVGYARSGHSIIASMLDAHPNVVIAHEYSLFNQWAEKPELHSNKTRLFNTLYNSSRFSALNGLRQTTAKKKGYTLAITGWYQGRYDGTIRVIGDKAGGMTAQVYRTDKKKFMSLYQQLQVTVMIPVHAIHVLRNPYDNIATMLLYNEHIKKKVNETHKYMNEEGLKNQILAYFSQVHSVLEMIDKYKLNVITIHHSDFIANPKSTMRKVCLALFIPCSDLYLHMVSEKTFSSESHSRHLVQWTPELIVLVAENIQKYPLLKRYTFK